jgi:hypothetical protein
LLQINELLSKSRVKKAEKEELSMGLKEQYVGRGVGMGFGLPGLGVKKQGTGNGEQGTGSREQKSEGPRGRGRQWRGCFGMHG